MEEDIKKDYQENHDTLVTFGSEGYTMRKDDPLTKEAIKKSKALKEATINKALKEGQISLFEGLNLSDKREEGESFDDYKDRRKTNKNLLKIYKTLGRERCMEEYPQGFKYAIAQTMQHQIDAQKNKEKPPLKATINNEDGSTTEIPVVIKNDDDDTTV